LLAVFGLRSVALSSFLPLSLSNARQMLAVSVCEFGPKRVKYLFEKKKNHPYTAPQQQMRLSLVLSVAAPPPPYRHHHLCIVAFAAAVTSDSSSSYSCKL